MYFKVQFDCVLSNHVNPRHTRSQWYYSWMFSTPIPHPLHLYHNYFHYHATLALAFTHPHSAACKVSRLQQKVIRCLYWCAEISLSSSHCCSDGRWMWHAGGWHPTSALSTIQFEHDTINVNPSKWPDNVTHPIIVFWCGYHQGISICSFGGRNINFVLGAKWYSLVVHTVSMCTCLSPCQSLICPAYHITSKLATGQIAERFRPAEFLIISNRAEECYLDYEWKNCKCVFFPPLWGCLNQLNKPAWYLMACELQLLEQYYGWAKSGAPHWNSNSVWKLFVLVLVLQGLRRAYSSITQFLTISPWHVPQKTDREDSRGWSFPKYRHYCFKAPNSIAKEVAAPFSNHTCSLIIS